MAYNLRSRSASTSAPEGSGVAHTSEGLGLSPVEFAMSEQATAGHGPDLLGLPIVIEGSPEARQTAAMVATSGTEAGLDRDAEQTGTPDTMVAHPTSSVYEAGATGPALAQARDTTKQDVTDPSQVPPHGHLVCTKYQKSPHTNLVTSTYNTEYHPTATRY